MVGERSALYAAEAEFGYPAWVFGLRSFAFLGDGRIFSAYDRRGRTTFALLDPETGTLEDLELPYDALSSPSVAAEGSTVVFAGGSATIPTEIVRLDVSSGATETLRRSAQVPVDASHFSLPRAIEFPTENDLTAHALFYPPVSPEYAAPEGELPPLIVMSHGGPTSSASPVFSLDTQFWTSRGFAVVDVNYGGSTGYGRAYRERLNGQWGVVDLQDCVNAARFLVDEGEADRRPAADHRRKRGRVHDHLRADVHGRVRGRKPRTSGSPTSSSSAPATRTSSSSSTSTRWSGRTRRRRSCTAPAARSISSSRSPRPCSSCREPTTWSCRRHRPS